MSIEQILIYFHPLCDICARIVAHIGAGRRRTGVYHSMRYAFVTPHTLAVLNIGPLCCRHYENAALRKRFLMIRL